MKIIGVGHRQETGKDTLVRLIISEMRASIDYRAKIIERRGFADPLYDICYRLYSWAGFQVRQYYAENPKAKNIILPVLNRTPRQVLIAVGNKMRDQDENVWINVCLKTPCDYLFVPDLRFPNEVKAIRESGGYVIKVNRSSVPIKNDGADDPLANYEDWDMVVNNEGTLSDLMTNVKIIIKRFIV